MELIIELLRLTSSSDTIKRKIAKIKSFDILFILINQHGLNSLIYNKIRNYKDLLEDSFINKLKLSYLDIIKDNMNLTYNLKIIDKLFKKEKIKYVSFKGPILSTLAYGDIISRRYLDLDILVDKNDLEKICFLLESNGFKTNINKEHITDNRFLDISKDIMFFNEKQNIILEVHWKLFEKRFFFQNLSLNDLAWKKVSIAKVKNFSVPTFDKDYLVFYLIIHGSKHFWERIEWLYNIYLLLNENKINVDLKKVLVYADIMHANTMLNVFFNLLEISFNYKIDKNILVLDKKSKIIAEKIIIYWSSTERENNKINLNEIKFMISMQDSIINKLKVIFKTIFQIKVCDFTFIRIPKKLNFLYYLIRPVRVILDLIKK